MKKQVYIGGKALSLVVGEIYCKLFMALCCPQVVVWLTLQ